MSFVLTVLKAAFLFLTPLGWLIFDLWFTFFLVKFFLRIVFKILHLAGGGAKRFEKTFISIEEGLRSRNRKTIVFVGLPAAALFFFFSSNDLFSISLSGGVEVFSILITLGMPLFASLVLNVFAKFLVSFSTEGSEGDWVQTQEGFIQRGNSETYDAIRDKAGDFAEHAKRDDSVLREEGLSRSALSKEGESFIAAELEEIPLIGDELAGIVAGSGALGPAILVIVVLLMMFVAQFAIYTLVVLPWLGGQMAAILGPSGGAAAQYGEDTAAWARDSIGDRYVGSVQLNDEMQAVGEARQRVYCLFKGPACLRQWQFNNTQRPDSSDVGEEFGLEVREFRLGSGDSIDVAYKDEGYSIPVSFQISNTRHGLDGIIAKNVQYRVKIVDSRFGPNNPYCDTGWQHVDAFDSDGDGADNDVYPGTSAATGFLRIDNLTLGDCNMRQPALGDYRSAQLYVKYDYFSQATLYFDAMSRDYQVNQDISVAPKDSVTADTPVKAAINVMDPAIFETELGGINSQQFPVRVTLNSEDRSVDYQVKDFKIRKSSAACVTDGDGDCADQESEYMECSFQPITYQGDSNNFFEPDQTAKKQMIVSAEGGIENDYWFTRNRPAPIIGCQMQLDESQNFNPSGETLTMGVAANYTVRLENSIESLKLINSRCTTINCPILEPISLSKLAEDPYRSDVIGGHDFDSSEDSMVEYWEVERSICNGVDAGNGCAVTEELDGNSDIIDDLEADRGEFVISKESSGECTIQRPNAEGCKDEIGVISENLLQKYLKNLGEHSVKIKDNGEAELEETEPSSSNDSSTSSDTDSDSCETGGVQGCST